MLKHLNFFLLVVSLCTAYRNRGFAEFLYENDNLSTTITIFMNVSNLEPTIHLLSEFSTEASTNRLH